MGDTNMDEHDDLVDYNEEDPIDPIAGKTHNAPNKGDGNPPEEPDWTFDDEQKKQHQAKYGDSIFYEPYAPKPPRGSVEDIQHRLRVAGARLKKDLNRSLLTDPQAWTVLRRPASIHSAQRTFAEMLGSVPSAGHEHFHELGDGYVCMSLHAMEKYLYV
jgi:hypothetical protein